MGFEMDREFELAVVEEPCKSFTVDVVGSALEVNLCLCSSMELWNNVTFERCRNDFVAC